MLNGDILKVFNSQQCCCLHIIVTTDATKTTNDYFSFFQET